MDTIVALATARGKAGVAVVRVSGPLAWSAALRLGGSLPQPRQAGLRFLRGDDGEIIDQALVLLFAQGQSFTGDEVAEFHLHGSTAVISAVLRVLLAIPGLRAAEPGEFTRRAFEAGRLDLVQVEGLADLIDAETEAQRKLALRVLEGETHRKVEAWREGLITALAMTEAALDFADEELPTDMTELVSNPLREVATSLRAEEAGFRTTERIREGFEVAIIGAVNAGKSTLLNRLAGRDAAITSEVAGTTRDVIEVRMEIGGLPVTLIDTAGLRETTDKVEQIGIARGQERARKADLRVYVKSDPGEEISPQTPDDIVVQGKADVWRYEGISGVTGQGVDALLNALEARLGGRLAASSVFSRARQFERISAAAASVDSALVRAQAGTADWELAAEDIRRALFHLEGLVGRVEADDILGQIFSAFCIGK
jgi:tRNA modification GTPase